MMTRREAIDILRNVWGRPGVIGAHDIARLMAEAHEGETLMDCCARLAGIDLRGVSPCNYRAISSLCARAEVALAQRS